MCLTCIKHSACWECQHFDLYKLDGLLFLIFQFVHNQLPEDLNALWAYVTFYGGECQLNLNKKVTHLVVKEPKGVSAWHQSLPQLVTIWLFSNTLFLETRAFTVFV